MRALVSAMAGLHMTHDQLAMLIINPATGKAIDKNTLERAFQRELANGNAKLKGSLRPS
jgi:hypothetical protein